MSSEKANRGHYSPAPRPSKSSPSRHYTSGSSHGRHDRHADAKSSGHDSHHHHRRSSPRRSSREHETKRVKSRSPAAGKSNNDIAGATLAGAGALAAVGGAQSGSKFPFFVEKYGDIYHDFTRVYNGIESILLATAFREVKFMSPGNLTALGASLFLMWRNVLKGVYKQLKKSNSPYTYVSAVGFALITTWMAVIRGNGERIRRKELGLL